MAHHFRGTSTTHNTRSNSDTYAERQFIADRHVHCGYAFCWPWWVKYASLCWSDSPAMAETLGSTIRPIHSLLTVEETPFIDSTSASAVRATTWNDRQQRRFPCAWAQCCLRSLQSPWNLVSRSNSDEVLYHDSGFDAVPALNPLYQDLRMASLRLCR